MSSLQMEALASAGLLVRHPEAAMDSMALVRVRIRQCLIRHNPRQQNTCTEEGMYYYCSYYYNFWIDSYYLVRLFRSKFEKEDEFGFFRFNKIEKYRKF